jgi:two-component system sensor histidine kinase BarA
MLLLFTDPKNVFTHVKKRAIADPLVTRHNRSMKLGIKHQVLLLALLPTIIVSTLLVVCLTSLSLPILKEALLDQGKTHTLTLAKTSEYAVSSRNKNILQNLATITLNELKAKSISFYTDSGAILANAGNEVFHFKIPIENAIEKPFSMYEYVRTVFKWSTTKENTHPKVISVQQNHKLSIKENNHTIVLTTPITIFENLNDVPATLTRTAKLVGWLKVELENSSINAYKNQILLRSSMIFLFMLLCSGFYATRLGHHVTRPILTLAQTIEQAIERIKSGDLNTKIEIASYRELNTLASGINTMALFLKNAQTELQTKINQATVSLRRTLETIEIQNIELGIARKTAENANKIKSEFLADMSHEIRTPLNGIIGFINVLQKTELNQKQKDHIITMQKSANNLLAIINDILDFSKIEAGKLRIEYMPMDIRDCIDEVLNLLTPYANEKNLVLVPLIYSDLPSLVLGDPLRIKQIITNLVNNAIKFTQQGSVIIRVMLEHKTDTQLTIRVNISDTGIGLSTEEQKVLFQAFNQAQLGTSRKFGGTGLGLVICKKLVEQMGGTIGVESEPQKGSTFWFTFQASQHKTLDKIQKPSFEPSVAIAANPEKISSMPKPTDPSLPDPTDRLQLSNNQQTTCHTPPEIHILTVDDNPENLKLITILLEDMGLKVTAVESAEEAIKAANQPHFDLILMDIRMPKMDGIEASYAIRHLETSTQHPPSPIIALTAHALESEKKALLAAGIDDYLAKPIGEPELKKVLQKWIPTITLDTESTKMIDWELGKSLAGGRIELAKELLEKLMASLPQEKVRINESYLQKNWEALRNHVHKLHGACCYCGVPKLKEVAQQLEAAAANRTLDAIPARLEALNLAIDMLLKESI